MSPLPRSSTGLIPRTAKKKQDELMNRKWITLPPQPKAEMWRYRGDYINSKNRKLAAKQIVKSKEISGSRLDATNADIELSSTTAIPPRSPRDSPTKGSIGWNDKSYVHTSFKLTPDEERKRAENNSKFVNFLRVEACKRHARASKRQPATNPPQDEAAPKLVKKPPVPRLSALARARAEGKKYTPKPKKVSSNLCKDASSDDKSKDKEARKYLAFISSSDHTKAKDTKTKKPTPQQEPVASMQRNVNDDDSIFRLQLERIVRRASDLVIEKQKHSPEVKQNDIPPPSRLKEDTTKSDMRSRHSKLDELEKRLARISGSTFISDDSTTDHTDKVSEDVSSCGKMSCSIDTEVVPRVPVQMHSVPMSNVQNTLRQHEWTSLYDHLYNDSCESSDRTSTSSSSSEQLLWEGNDICIDKDCPSHPVQPSIAEDDESQSRSREHDDDDGSLEASDFFALFE